VILANCKKDFIPLGTPNEIKGLHENVALFSYVGKICPTPCPTDLIKFKKRLFYKKPKGGEKNGVQEARSFGSG